jgi:hypothetical protein
MPASDLETEGFSATNNTFMFFSTKLIHMTQSQIQANDSRAASVRVEFEVFKVSSEPRDLDFFLREHKGHSISNTILQNTMYVVTQKEEAVLAVLGITLDIFYSYEGDSLRLVSIYLSKLDTTGLVKPKHVQRSLIIHVLRDLILSLSKYNADVQLYLTSLPHPYYLFPLSSDIKSKRVLSSRQLIYWWRDVLESVGSQLNEFNETFGVSKY